MKWKAELIEHRNAKRIGICFEKNPELIQRIKKDVSLHWLRHSYATHLLENGTDLKIHPGDTGP